MTAHGSQCVEQQFATTSPTPSASYMDHTYLAGYLYKGKELCLLVRESLLDADEQRTQDAVEASQVGVEELGIGGGCGEVECEARDKHGAAAGEGDDGDVLQKRHGAPCRLEDTSSEEHTHNRQDQLGWWVLVDDSWLLSRRTHLWDVVVEKRIGKQRPYLRHHAAVTRCTSNMVHFSKHTATYLPGTRARKSTMPGLYRVVRKLITRTAAMAGATYTVLAVATGAATGRGACMFLLG